MKWFVRLPGVRELYARGLLFPAVLVMAMLGLLLQGALYSEAPEEARADVEPRNAPVEVPGIRPDLDKSPLEYNSDYWRQLGERVRNKIVLLGEHRTPGVVVAPGVALTTLHAADDLEAGQTGEQDGGREVLGVDTAREMGLIAIKQQDPDASFSLDSYAVLPPGSSIAAVSVGPDDRVRVTPGSVVSLSTTREAFLDVAIPFSTLLEAAALVNLDGELIGVALRNDSGVEVMSLEEVKAVVEQLSQGPVCQAIEVGDLTNELRQALGISNGVTVEKVRRDAFLPEPSIQEGDVLLRWEGQEVITAGEFAGFYQAAEPGELVRYIILRGRQRISGGTRMPRRDCRPVANADHALEGWGVTLKWVRDTGWRVVAVAPESRAALAGLMEGDLIVAAEGTRLGQQDRKMFVRLEQSPRPVVLTLRRGDRVKLVAIGAASS